MRQNTRDNAEGAAIAATDDTWLPSRRGLVEDPDDLEADSEENEEDAIHTQWPKVLQKQMAFLHIATGGTYNDDGCTRKTRLRRWLASPSGESLCP